MLGIYWKEFTKANIYNLMETHQKPGTYAGVRFSTQTKIDLIKYCIYNNIPNPVSVDNLHSTLLYSRKHLPAYKACGDYFLPMHGKAKELTVWKTTPLNPTDEKTRCLILVYDCEDFIDRHKNLLNRHNTTHEYSDFTPHITLSYNIGNLDISNLPPYTGSIVIVREYQEELDLDWAKNKGIAPKSNNTLA